MNKIIEVDFSKPYVDTVTRMKKVGKFSYQKEPIQYTIALNADMGKEDDAGWATWSDFGYWMCWIRASSFEAIPNLMKEALDDLKRKRINKALSQG